MFNKKILPLILFLFLAILNFTGQKSTSAAFAFSQVKVHDVSNQKMNLSKKNI